MRSLLAGLLLLVASCAARGPAPEVTADLSRAGALASLAYVDLDGTTPEERQTPYNEWRKQVQPLRDRIAASDGTLLAGYLVLSADCGDRTIRESIDTARIRALHGSAPLIEYRLALCGLSSDDGLRAVAASDPRWHEARWIEGRSVLATSRDVRAAATLFEAAAEGLPDAPAVLLSLAGAQRALRRLDAALASYDRVLAIVQTRRAALLGRVITLSYLDRHAEAVDIATRMIELGTYSIGDARYWRSWNLYRLKQLDAASADAEQALLLMSNTNVYLLAGLIKLDMKLLDDAESRLVESKRLDPSNCQAQFYLGITYSSKPDWAQGAPAFTGAVSCFTQAAAAARAGIDRIMASARAPEVKDAEAAEHRTTLAESELRTAQSAFNAAQCLARIGNTTSAVNYLDIAVEHPQVKEQAERFRASLK